jgi:hypothetical protein
MKIKDIPAIGITGREVQFNHSELVVLKGVANRLKEVQATREDISERAKKLVTDRELLEDIKAMNVKVDSLLNECSSLLNNIVPEEVMSIGEAEISLFADPSVKEEE